MNGPAPNVLAPAPPLGYTPAGFWARYAAWSLDWLILSPLLVLLVLPTILQAFAAGSEWLAGLQDWLLDRVLRGQDSSSPLALMQVLMADPVQHAAAVQQVAQITAAVSKAVGLTAIFAGVYFIGFEASAWQATPGKRWLRLQVQDLHGQRPGLARVVLRFFSGFCSWLTLNLGHALVAFRHDGRALHDLLAGTRVIAQEPMPRRARRFLSVQVLALALLMVFVVLRMLWLLGQIASL